MLIGIAAMVTNKSELHASWRVLMDHMPPSASSVLQTDKGCLPIAQAAIGICIGAYRYEVMRCSTPKLDHYSSSFNSCH